MSIYNVHAGHGARDSKSCGAIGLICESTEARKVKNLVIKYLKEQGHTVYDCTVDYPSSSSDNLNKIVQKCNAHSANLDISIHFNAGGKQLGDSITTGVEVLTYDEKSGANFQARRIVDSIASLGFKNRGIKYRPNLAVLKGTKNDALLIECCFVDDPDDVAIYNADKMARAIVKGITGKAVGSTPVQEDKPLAPEGKEIYYRVVVGSYKDKASALAEVEKAKAKGYGSAFITAYVKEA